MPSPWTIVGEIAHLQIGSLAAELNLRHPQLGLHNVNLDGVALDGVPLGDKSAAKFLAILTQPVDRAEQIQDCYVRGADLVVTYDETPERNIRPQVYWRAFGFPEIGSQAQGVDVMFSTQTSKLYSDPTLFVESCFPATGKSRAPNSSDGPEPIVYRLASPAWSFAAAIHPSDFDSGSASLAAGGRGEVRYRLFAPGLEKGVIRRARLRGIFLPRAGDEDLAAASYAEFVTQELPLTT